MRYVVLVLAVINGGFMLLDGIYVMLNGKYIGPEKPGPWASLISFTGVDVFKLGPLFVVFGIAWLVFTAMYWQGVDAGRTFGIILSVLTLWYLPFGTLISIIVIVLLWFFSKSSS